MASGIIIDMVSFLIAECLLLTVGDIELSNNALDKSQIGCYIHLNNRLLDVMVLTDTQYLIKVPINTKSSDNDKITIIFKKLASGDDEEPLGKKF
jgi:hypothetical protein